jgi:serine/threonine-protein kinase RsbW
MIDSMSTADVANAEHFERFGTVADAATAGQTRDEFARWLATFFDLDPNRTSDLVLAINEALANSAEHAYPANGAHGTTDVRATYDPIQSTLTVTILDRGVWRTAGPSSNNRSRGRGIPLMTALSDDVSIQTSSRGTLVSLAWTQVRPR